jgi:hypothetical protein
MIRQMVRVLSLAVALPSLLGGCFLNAGPLNCDGPCFEESEESHQNSYVCACTCESTIRKVELRVAASSDDAERLADGSSLVDSADLEMTSQRLVGVRFADVPIPPGADILSAWVEFTPSGAGAAPLSIEIFGEAGDDAAGFSTAPDDLLSRPTTANSVVWTPAAWNLGDPPQQSTDLEPVLQEIIDRPNWAENNALVLIISTPAGNGIRQAHSYDGQPLNAPRLVVSYGDSSAQSVGPQELPVCMPDYFNPNLGGATPGDVDLQGDCKGRIEPTFEGLAQACGYPSQCTCSMQPDSRRFSDKCDQPCVEDPVDGDCSDFDPVGENVTATNAPGDEPICITNSPLASGIFGRRSECPVTGTAHVDVDGDVAEPRAHGVLYFRGDPCPGERCAIGMEYRLDIDSVTFRDVFGAATFTELAGLGESPTDSALIDANGNGRFAPGALQLSARGRRDGEAGAMVTRNAEAIDVEMAFGSDGPRCALNGTLLGGVDPETGRCAERGNPCSSDRECAAGEACTEVDSSPIMLGLDVAGAVVNQPPTADAGDDQVVQCPDAAILDGSGSSDLDGNLALFSWRRGGRSGPEVGFDEIAQVQQPLGRETYVLRVIDAFAQTDEDATTVAVIDTMAPALDCSLAVPVIEPTNRSMIDVGLTATARDGCEGRLPVSVSVFADEDGDSPTGQSNSSPDAVRVGIGTLRLRAERHRDGDGRVYLVVVDATDSSGNRGVNCCTAVVPYSKSLDALGSVQAQADAARAHCLATGGAAPAGYVPAGGRNR